MRSVEVRGALVGPLGVVASKVMWATTIGARRRGVLGRPALSDDEAIVLAPCRRVHTVGVAYALDVVFCDADWIVRHVQTLPPRRVSRRVGRASACIELVGGRAAACGLAPGVQLRFEERA